jgi:hypothetical protein
MMFCHELSGISHFNAPPNMINDPHSAKLIQNREKDSGMDIKPGSADNI